MKVKLIRNEDRESLDYLTVGKVYDFIWFGLWDSGEITDDVGDTLIILPHGICGHIGCKGWEVIDEN
jgi:hypothetical protein